MIGPAAAERAWLGLSPVGLFEAIHRDRQREELSIPALSTSRRGVQIQPGSP
jgi:hypothetical protein